MKAIAVLLACLLGPFGSSAFATSTSTADHSDLWWNAAENGWGAHVTQQDDVLFLVLYVYDEARRPRFLVAPDMRRRQGSPGIHEGALHRTTGPVFSGTFDPNLVSSTPVGDARLEFVNSGEARLEYTVGAIRVQKTLTRQLWRLPRLAGEYLGGIFATATASTCPLGLASIAYSGSLVITQEGEDVAIEMSVAPGFAENGNCRLTGRLVPQGALASISGTYACGFSNGNASSGSFELVDVESGPNGFGGRYSALEGQACRHTGFLGGTRRSRAATGSQAQP
jgi:hypothetical protein